ncbi:(3R)-hydroxymyristol acyl carrier protein dehydratase [uncultured delta proteobacterium]|uniref:3-hydroxyacyl-[acyl-carrier-protein] dehydratase FabZ n=1 Tax=uncultured delta proteobacterium TaxID=34034 RepID=A0A212JVZ3_9DELT|nr:(3R)-hydroxymyristol acyl carrier protein dehydratase [uncultured delta proteobacterium]
MSTEAVVSENALTMNIKEILSCLPHRYPFLLVDRVVSCVLRERIHAYKNVSMNEPFFQGHFPGLPVMPGVLIMEALAQAGALLVLADWPKEEIADSVFLFSGMENVKFRQPVVPGDRLDLECVLTRQKLQLWKMSGKALVDGKIAAQGELTAAVMRRGDM